MHFDTLLGYIKLFSGTEQYFSVLLRDCLLNIEDKSEKFPLFLISSDKGILNDYSLKLFLISLKQYRDVTFAIFTQSEILKSSYGTVSSNFTLCCTQRRPCLIHSLKHKYDENDMLHNSTRTCNPLFFLSSIICSI